MNKKIIGIIVVLLAIFVSIRVSGLQRPKHVEISQNYTDNEPISKSRYYEQLLSQKQLYAYQEICKRLDEFVPRELILEEAINMDDLEQIIHTLEMEYNYFYVYPPIAFTKENKILFYSNEQEENQKNQVEKLLINFTSQKEREQIREEDTYWIELDENGIVENYDDFIDNYVKQGEVAVSRFIDEQNQIKKLIKEILDSAPKTNKLKDILDYFQKYLIDYMEYDIESANVLVKGEMDGYDEARYTTHISCILNGKGTCMGISALYVELCRQKNINAYPILGTNQDGINHMWVAIYLNDQDVIFVDPTYAVFDDKIREYRDMEQMESIGYRFDFLSQRAFQNKQLERLQSR